MKQRISELEKLARQRMRLITPKNSAKVVCHDRFWSVPFLELYLDQCDDRVVDLPEDGYLLSQYAPDLARRIPVGRGPGSYGDEMSKRSWQVDALAVFGSACRVSGRLTEAEYAYRRAFELCELPIRDRSRAELLARFAVLRLVLNEPNALQLVEQAIGLFEGCNSRDGLAAALVIRGCYATLRQEPSGVVDYARALRLANLKTKRGARTYSTALQNMAAAINSSGVTMRELEAVYVLLQEVKRTLRRVPCSVRKMKVFWLEGLILENLGSQALAERRLWKARKGFEKLCEPVEFMAVSIDLSRLLFDEDAHGESVQFRANALAAARGWTEDPHALECLARQAIAEGLEPQAKKFRSRFSEQNPGGGSPDVQRQDVLSQSGRV